MPLWVGSPTHWPRARSLHVRKAWTGPDRRRPGSFTRPRVLGASWWASLGTLSPSGVSSHWAGGGRGFGKESRGRWGWGGAFPAWSWLATQPGLLHSQVAGTTGDGRVPRSQRPPGKTYWAHYQNPLRGSPTYARLLAGLDSQHQFSTRWWILLICTSTETEAEIDTAWNFLYIALNYILSILYFELYM